MHDKIAKCKNKIIVINDFALLHKTKLSMSETCISNRRGKHETFFIFMVIIVSTFNHGRL